MKYKIYMRFIGIIIFFLLITFIDIDKLKNVWESQINLQYLLVSFFLIPLVILIKSYRWLLILGVQAIKLNFINAYLIYFSSLFYGSISPGGVLGEITKILHLKNENNLSIKKITPAVFLDRIFDLVIISCIGIFCLTHFLLNNYVYSLLILLIGIIFPLSLLLMVLFKYLKKTKNKKFNYEKNIIFKTIFDVINLSKNIGFLVFFKALFVTIVGQIIACIQVIYIFKILKLDFTILYAFAINSLIVLISLIPITIAGIGSRDSLVILMFSLNNINIEYGILFSSLYLIIFNFGTYFFGFLSTMIKPLKIK